MTVTRWLVGWGVALCALGLSACSSDSFEPSAGSGGASVDGGAGSSGTGGGTSGTGGTGAQDAGADAPADVVTGSQPTGSACTAGPDCQSGYCVDDVCCDTACDGACVSCGLTGKEGTCSPHAKDTDPDTDCAGSDPACATTCDGLGACAFEANKPCGAASCANGQELVPRCDATGACTNQTKLCAPYACAATTCNTSCNTDTDCSAGNFCKSYKCVAKLDNGNACDAASWCKSGFCAGNVCCNTACNGANFSCSTGTCTCGGKVCGGSESCVNWYRDQDGDTYGDNANKVLGCSTSGPSASGYVSNNQDCYDLNKDAKPGQTAFFDKARDGTANGSYDYNCDTAQTGEYPNIGSTTCKDCGAIVPTGAYSLFCPVPPCPITCAHEGFRSAVTCGTTATLYRCFDDLNGNPAESTQTGKTQRCH